MSSEAPVCPGCRRPLAGSATRGLCQRCLLGRALLSEVEEEVREGRRFIGDYEILGPIARGGMGIVYRARQRALNRIVALKLILAGDLAAPDFVERFRVEAESVASLEHPNIVPIYEIGEDDGRHYFSMRLLEGGNLADRLERGPRLQPADSAALVAKLARAIHHAHQRGILHRDVKPTNILLDTAGEPLLTDFGLAKLVERETRITRTLAVLGTPSYISPEQAAGNAGQLTTAVDVYGLGAVLYELLAGVPPFAGGTTVATIRMVLEKDPEPPTRRHPEIPRDLETICLKCLEKDPVRRYASAEALAEDLDRWANGEPISARPASSTERSVKWVRRHPAYAGLGLALVLSLAAVAVVSNVARARVSRALDIARSQKAEIERQGAELRQQKDETVRELSRSLFLQGVKIAESGQPSTALAYWAQSLRLSPTNHAAASRIFHALVSNRYARRDLPPFRYTGPVAVSMFSPDGGILAVAAHDGRDQVTLWNLTRSNRLHDLPVGLHPRALAFSTDGSQLAVVCGFPGWGAGHAQVWDVATGKPVTERVPLERGATHVQFSPDGTRVLAGAFYSRPRILSLPRPEHPGPAPEAHTPHAIGNSAWDADSQSYLYLEPGTGVLRIDATTGETLATWTNTDPSLTGLDVSADGSRFVLFGKGSRAYLSSTQPGAKPHAFDTGSQVYQAVFDPSGDRIALANDTGQIAVRSGHDGTLIGTCETGYPQKTLSFDPTGTRIVSRGRDHAVHVLDASTARPLCEAIRQRGLAEDAWFDPTGERIVVSSSDGLASVWRLNASVAEETVLEQSHGAVQAEFSRDGRHVIAAGPAWPGLQRWDTETGRRLESAGTSTPAWWFEISRNGHWMISRHVDSSTLQVCDETGRPQGSPFRSDSPARIAHVTANGDSLAILTASRQLRWIDWREQRDRMAPITVEGVPRLAGILPDGRHAFVACDDAYLRVWEIPSGKPVLPAIRLQNSPERVDVVAGGRLLMASAAVQLRFFDARTLKEDGVPLEYDVPVILTDVSHDGARVVASTVNHDVWVRERKTGRQWGEENHGNSRVSCLEFDADARRMVIAREDGSLQVHDAETGQAIATLLRPADPGHGNRNPGVLQAHFSPDGRRLLTLGTDALVRLWDLGPTDRDPIPEWLAGFAESVAGLRLASEAGDVLRLQPVESGMGPEPPGTAPPKPDAWTRMAQWFLANPSTRARSPILQPAGSTD